MLNIVLISLSVSSVQGIKFRISRYLSLQYVNSLSDFSVFISRTQQISQKYDRYVSTSFHIFESSSEDAFLRLVAEEVNRG